jgi:NTE family protein
MPDADLVLEGGGVKGIALVGAISVLEENGYRFHRVAGTSAGAIVGALVAAGCSAAELTELMESVDYRKFRDTDLLDRLGPIGKGLSIFLDEGVYEGEYLKQWLGEQLARHNVHTFGNLALHDQELSLDPNERYRLVVNAADITTGQLARLPFHYKPVYGIEPDDVPVVDAVRASMSIPFFFEPARLRGRHEIDHWLLDGGMLSNYPIDVFDRATGVAPRWPTFGIKLSGRPDADRPFMHVRGAISMGRAMVATAMGFYDQMHINAPGTLERTIFVDTSDVSAINFDLDLESRARLYQSGRDAAEEFLRTWNFEQYKERFRSPDSVDAERTELTVTR